MNRAILVLALVCVVSIPAAHAQDLPPAEITEKENRKMDSRLANLYDSAVAGTYDPEAVGSAQGMSFSTLSTSPDGERVQVVLVMVSEGAPIPSGLDIIVETTYEELVQATIPITNLEAAASDKNVQFVKVPARPVPAMVLPPMEQIPPTTVTPPATQPDSYTAPPVVQPDSAIAVPSTVQPEPSSDESGFSMLYLLTIPIAAGAAVAVVMTRKKRMK